MGRDRIAGERSVTAEIEARSIDGARVMDTSSTCDNVQGCRYREPRFTYNLAKFSTCSSRLMNIFHR